MRCERDGARRGCARERGAGGEEDARVDVEGDGGERDGADDDGERAVGTGGVRGEVRRRVGKGRRGGGSADRGDFGGELVHTTE